MKSLGLSDFVFKCAAQTTTSVGVLITDNQLKDNPIVYANPFFQKLTGYSEQEIIGKNCRFLQGPGSDRNVVAQIHRSIEAGIDFCGDILNYRKDGSTFWNHLTISPVKNSEGKIICFVGIQQDITAQKIAEERLKAIVEATSDVIYFANAEGDSNDENLSWRKFTGQSREQIRRGGWINALHPQDQSTVFATVSCALSEGRPYQMVNRLRRYDGQWRYMFIRGIPLLDSSGHVREWVGACQDITDQKQLEIDLNSAVAQREEILSIASHDLKTPLSALKLHLELLCKEVAGKVDPVSTAISSRVTSSLKSVDAAIALLNELLDVTRIQAGRLFLNKKQVNLKTLIEQMVEQMSEEFRNSGESVKLLLTEPIVGFWDEVRIRQVVSNLLSNAIKFGNGKPIEVKAHFDKLSGRVKLQVIDHGIGIPLEKQELIFRRFERAVSDSGTYGLGLGLYIVKQIVEAHGGVVRVDSELGKGATFTVELPT